MTRVARWVALFTLAAFVGLTSAEAVHAHGLLQTDNACSFCNITHQTPAPNAPVTIQHVSAVAGDSPTFDFVEPVLPILTVANGRAPPAV